MRNKNKNKTKQTDKQDAMEKGKSTSYSSLNPTTAEIYKTKRAVWIAFAIVMIFLLTTFFLAIGSYSTLSAIRGAALYAPILKACLLSNLGSLPIWNQVTPNEISPIGGLVRFDHVVDDTDDDFNSKMSAYKFTDEGSYRVNGHFSFHLGGSESSQVVITMWKITKNKPETIKSATYSNPNSSVAITNIDTTVDITDDIYFKEGDYVYFTVQQFDSTSAYLLNTFDCGSNFMEIYLLGD